MKSRLVLHRKTNAQKSMDKLLRSMRKDSMARERKTMSDEEIERRASTAIERALVERNRVDDTDLAGANLPMERARPIAKRVIARLRIDRPELFQIEAIA